MKLVIIDYNAGNVQSVKFALERLGAKAELSNKADAIQSADKVIFPGVGEAAYAMQQLQQLGLDTLIPKLKQPVLGICLGMQLLCSHSEEGDTPCLGVFKENVKRFTPAAGLKVPQMGWNRLENMKGRLYEGAAASDYAYFVHSYYAPRCAHSSATAHYGFDFSASLEHGNFFAAQFHPEKSGAFGELLLRNFLAL
jgi:glutamine amidotransferase